MAVLLVTGLAAVPIVRSAAAPAPAAVVAAVPSPSAGTSAPVTGPPRVKGTPAGLLTLLLENLPRGTTSHYVGLADQGDVSVQTYLDRGQGPGMIRLYVMTRTASQLKGTWIPLGNDVEYQVIRVPATASSTPSSWCATLTTLSCSSTWRAACS